MQRFWTKVDKTDGCWLWIASIKLSGYGQFSLNGRPQLAHRVAYELVVGPIPDGADLDHLCRNTRCVNPAHLEPVSHRENMRRGHFGSKTHCPAGHEYSPTNTRHSGGRRPGRHCITCQNVRNAARVAA